MAWRLVGAWLHQDRRGSGLPDGNAVILRRAVGNRRERSEVGRIDLGNSSALRY